MEYGALVKNGNKILFCIDENILAGVMGREMLQGTEVKRRLLGMKHLHVTGMQNLDK